MGKLYMAYNRFRNFVYSVEPIRKAYYRLKINARNKALSEKLVQDQDRNLGLIVEALRGLDIQAFCAYGTLLGIVRDGGLIPYDTDMDMAILESESFSWDALEKALESHGLKKECSYAYEGNVTEQRYILPDGLWVDFFLFQKKDPDTLRSFFYFKDRTVAYENRDVFHVKANYYPMIHGVTEMEFHGMRVPVPENPEKHVEDVYGPGWRTPDPNCRPDEKVNRMPKLGRMIRV